MTDEPDDTLRDLTVPLLGLNLGHGISLWHNVVRLGCSGSSPSLS